MQHPPTQVIGVPVEPVRVESGGCIYPSIASIVWGWFCSRIAEYAHPDMPLGCQASRRKKSEKWLIEKINYSDSEIEEMGYCNIDCGKYHRDIAMRYGAKAPSAYATPDETSLKDAELT